MEEIAKKVKIVKLAKLAKNQCTHQHKHILKLKVHRLDLGLFGGQTLEAELFWDRSQCGTLLH